MNQFPAYPTDEQIDRIRGWHVEAYRELPAHVASLWAYPDLAREVRPGLWVFATRGWSGNEELLTAMRASQAWQLLAWDSLYIPGGLLIVAVNDRAREELHWLFDFIRRWAWAEMKPPPTP
jgi:hypothetical protein